MWKFGSTHSALRTPHSYSLSLTALNLPAKCSYVIYVFYVVKSSMIGNRPFARGIKVEPNYLSHFTFNNSKFPSMKKLMLLLLAGSLVSAVAFAQDQKEMKHDKTEWDKKVKDELKLTDEQVVKYDALNKEYQDKFDALSKDGGLTKEAHKEKKMALKKEKESKLFEFISADQQAKYKELIEKKKKESKPGA